MSINPFHAAKAIQDSYISYLSSAFSFQNPALQEEFTSLLNQPGRLIKGPILRPLRSLPGAKPSRRWWILEC